MSFLGLKSLATIECGDGYLARKLFHHTCAYSLVLNRGEELGSWRDNVMFALILILMTFENE